MVLIAKVVIASTNDGQRGLFAAKDIEADDIILTLDGETVTQPTEFSMEIEQGKYLDSVDETFSLVNHSCDPDAYVDWAEASLRAKRPIRLGEEITYNYLTVGYLLPHSFVCRCGSTDCVGEVRGFKHLSYERQLRLQPWLSPFLSIKLSERRRCVLSSLWYETARRINKLRLSSRTGSRV